MNLTLDDIMCSKFRIINGIFVHDNLKLDSVIYKYIKKEHFIDLMQKSQLYVANRSSFSDRSFKLFFLSKKFKIIYFRNLSLYYIDDIRNLIA